MSSGHITSWQINGETMETVTNFIFLGSKTTVDGDCSHEIKRCLLLGRKSMETWTASIYFLGLFYFSFIFISWRLITLQYYSGFCHTLTWISHGFTCVPHPDPPSRLPLHPIPLGLPSAPAQKERHCFADKGPHGQNYVFFGSHVWMWEWDHKEDWVPKNRCFWTVVLEKTRVPWTRKRWLDGITDSVDMSLSKLQAWWRTGKPGVLHSMVLQRVGHDWATEQQQGGKCSFHSRGHWGLIEGSGPQSYVAW